MKIGTWGTAALLLAATLASSAALAQVNNNPANATRIVVDADWVNTSLSPTILERWYQVGFVQGRSYCVMTMQNDVSVDTATTDTRTYVYSDSAGTVQVFFNDDNFAEPVSGWFSRNCFIWTLATNLDARLKVNIATAPLATQYLRFRVVDTTINSPWFFVDGPTSYNGWIELANTTNTAVQLTVTIRNGAGSTLGTPQTRVISAYGNNLLNARTDFGSTIASGSGSVQIAHDGAPGAIVGNVTSMSATTGLSFDSPMTRRQSW